MTTSEAQSCKYEGGSLSSHTTNVSGERARTKIEVGALHLERVDVLMVRVYARARVEHVRDGVIVVTVSQLRAPATVNQDVEQRLRFDDQAVHLVQAECAVVPAERHRKGCRGSVKHAC